ncbi:MAG TPA: hypothetical protein CFH81_08800 [Sulfurovum sp. UBA12169]|nr:MAG TPA: hypothetical protein CFH81_08800 [Sulfurovum sp. UBA12169]
MAYDVSMFMADVETISDELRENSIYKDAKESIEKAMDNVEISSEEKKKLLSGYLQNFSIPALQMAFDAASKIKLLEHEIEKAAFEKLRVLADIKKNYGFGNASAEAGLGEDTKDGLVDEQKAGFFKDQIYKLAKTLSENSYMLAQNDVPTPEWMADAIKLCSEFLSAGKIDITVDRTLPETVTTVTYNANATTPNGLDV